MIMSDFEGEMPNFGRYILGKLNLGQVFIMIHNINWNY